MAHPCHRRIPVPPLRGPSIDPRRLGDQATLNNGVAIPLLGFGEFQTPPDVTTAAVKDAHRAGYRTVDTPR
jgi:hypothetical protein